MGSSLRAPFLKALLVGGALLAASVAFAQDEAGAEPVVSSWYGPGFEGAITASGEPFDPYDYTAASPYLPFGTRLYVCYRGCVTVRVNDRGPYVYGRELDLSQAAAEAIGLTYVGVDVIDATVLGYGPS
ncbi:MAG: septal ring lytic transglycosylase RlpA family lipoprotein [Rubrobacter sp.]|nr:septal ring lytic transglycosylase RlpA family lipoprotein [Rubrobacter sp.]